MQINGEADPVVMHFALNAPILQIVSDYNHTPGVEYAEPNYVYHAVAFDPNDSYYSNQWYLRQIGMPSAWEKTTGSPDVIIWTNPGEVPGDGIDNDHNGFTDDVHGWDFVDWSNDPRPSATTPYSKTALHHGTLVSGIADAVGNNGQGIAGVAWHAKIMPLRVLDRSGKGDVEEVAEAVEYAVKNGAKIINLSFVGSGFSQRLYDVLRQAYQSGVIIVAAAGNTNETATGDGNLDNQFLYPICYDAADTSGQNWIVGVTATDILDQRATFANYGSRCVDIAAPGASIIGTEVYDPALNLNDTYGGPWSGTSLAAPMVSGAAALVWSTNPNFTNQQVIDRLLSTADDISTLNPRFKGKLGKGRVDVARALLTKGSTGSSGAALPTETGRIVTMPVNLWGDDIRLLTPDGKGAKTWVHLDPTFVGNGSVAVSENARSSPPDNNFHLSAVLRGDQSIVVGEGAGGHGHVRMYDVTGEKLNEWRVFGAGFRGGVSVAAGNVTGNGEGSIVVMPRSGGGPQVRVFHRDGTLISQFFAYAPSQRGGYAVAVADVDGDGVDEIITSSLAGADPIRVFKTDGSLLAEWQAFPENPHAGVSIAAGDFSGDGRGEIAAAIVSPTSSIVKIFNGAGTELINFLALPKNVKTGLSLAAGDVNADGVDELVVAPAAHGGPQVTIFDNHGRLLGQFFAFDKWQRGGLTLAVLR